jgi:hypothetical protein
MTLDEIEALINKGKKAQNTLLWLRDVDLVKAAMDGRIFSIGISYGSATGAGAAARDYLRELESSVTDRILDQIRNHAVDDLEEVKNKIAFVVL